MYSVSKTRLFVQALSMAIAIVGAQATTVTVDPNGPTVPGVSYRNINAAVDNLNRIEGQGGHGWADGNNDTILLVTSAIHFVTGEISPSPFNPDRIAPITPPPSTGVLTIRSAGPGNALIRANPFFVRFRVWDIETPGTYFIENITHIGHPGNDPITNDYRTVFRVDADDPGDIIHLTARNCIVTANNGSDGPVTDFSTPFPTGRVGTFMRAFYNGDGTHEGAFTFTAENCIFAYLAADAESGVPGVGTALGGGIEVFREDAAANLFTPNATKEVTLRHCLIVNCLDEAIAIDGASHEAVLTIEDCLITNQEDFVLKLPNESNDSWRGGRYNFVHSILESQSNAIGNPGTRTFDGTINLDEVTVVTPGNDSILLTSQNPGEASFTLSDVIAFGVSSLLRLQPDPGANSGPSPFVLTADSIASDSAVLASQAAGVQATINAGVVTTDNPGFISSDIPSAITGIFNWNSEANDLFDVGNMIYGGKGTTSPDLRGGADYTFTIPPSSVEDWRLYQ